MAIETIEDAALTAQDENEKTIQWAVDQLRMCQMTGFYGKVTFIFENGKVVRRTAESSEVPPKIDKPYTKG